MDRRTAIRTLAAAATAPWVSTLASPAELAGLTEAHKALGCSEPLYRPQALDEHQLALVRTVADIILPRTDSPGATDAGVHAFVDIIVAEWFDDDEADRFTAGLAALDQSASDQFGAGFLEIEAEQQTAIVAALDEQLFELRETDAEAASDSFFHWMKRLTLTGYFTSEQGSRVIGRRIFPGRFEGCVVPEVTR